MTMLSKIRCEECGQALSEDDLNCWACGALTERGRAQRRAAETGGADDDEWRRSVEAARRRREATPAVDPDEALRRTLAEQGAVEELARLAHAKEPEDISGHTRYSTLRGYANILNYLAMGSGAILGVMAIIIVAFALSVATSGEAIAAMAGFGAAVIAGIAALLSYYLLRLTAEMVNISADVADNTRRALAILNDLRDQLRDKPDDAH
jgi:hypothetical protein